MSVLCVIPARGKSKRVPNKNLRMVLGKPLIGHTIEAALESQLCDKVVVSTDDAKISKVVKEFGIEVITRPAEIALDTSAIDDSLRHAVRDVEKKEGFVPDIVVLLQANVPVRRKGEIDEVIKRLTEIDDATAVVTGYLIDQRPEWMKVIDPSTDKADSFMGPTQFYRKQDLQPLYLFDGAVAVIRRDVLMSTEGIKKAHGFLGDKVYIMVHEMKYATEIDTEEEFELAEYYLSKQNGI